MDQQRRRIHSNKVGGDAVGNSTLRQERRTIKSRFSGDAVRRDVAL